MSEVLNSQNNQEKSTTTPTPQLEGHPAFRLEDPITRMQRGVRRSLKKPSPYLGAKLEITENAEDLRVAREQRLAVLDPKFEKTGDGTRVRLKNFDLLREKVEDKELDLTDVFPAEIREVVIDGVSLKRGAVDGKMVYFSAENGQKIPFKLDPSKNELDLMIKDLPKLSYEDVLKFTEIEMKLGNRRRELVREMLEKRQSVSKDAQRAVGITPEVLGDRSWHPEQKYNPSSSFTRPVAARDRYVSRNSVPRRAFESLNNGVSAEALAGPEKFRDTPLSSLMINEAAGQRFAEYSRAHPGLLEKSPVQAQRITSSKMKQMYVRQFNEVDIKNAMGNGWRGAEQSKPLMITRNQMAYLFIPANKGDRIDLEKPETFHLIRMPLSTGRGGWGNVPESNATPEGLLRAYAEEETDPGAAVGWYRIRLEGLEASNANSDGRAIRMHEGNLNRPSSGCLRLGGPETVFMASQVAEFGNVYINVSREQLNDTAYDQFAESEKDQDQELES